MIQAWCHRKVDLCELKASMVYIVKSKPAGLYSETLSQNKAYKIMQTSLSIASKAFEHFS